MPRDDRLRSDPADPDQGGLFSARVIAGERPRWVYRREPVSEVDSGWNFFQGSESPEWLDEPGHCVLQHVAHALARWPELRRVLRDDRVKSAWEWHPILRRYREVTDWEIPAD